MVLSLKTWKSRTLPGLSTMKNIIVITGGAGFVGSNLIRKLLTRTKFYILSLDNYSTGKIKNHIKSNRIKYIKGNTVNIKIILKNISVKLIPFFILASSQEFIKVLKNLMIVLIRIQ